LLGATCWNGYDESGAASGILSYVAVSILFAVSGALSSRIVNFDGNIDFGRDFLLPLVALPFGVLCMLILVRSIKPVVILPLIVAVWLAAFWTATAMSVRSTVLDNLPTLAAYIPMCTAGLIGGLGLALFLAIHRRGVLAWRYLIGAAIAGSVSSLPFGFWLDTRQASETGPSSAMDIACAFAIWQATMGTYLYSVYSRLKGAEERAKGIAIHEPAEGGLRSSRAGDSKRS
jgi:hypothetical protein